MRWRLVGAVVHCADHLMFECTNPWELDDALESAGFQMGICALQDLVGIDTIHAELAEKFAFSPIIPRMLGEGRLGRKAGVGWYRYPGGGGRVTDPLIEDLIREEAYFAGLERRDISEAEIVRTIVDLIATEVRNLRENGVDLHDVKEVLSTDLQLSDGMLNQVFAT